MKRNIRNNLVPVLTVIVLALIILCTIVVINNRKIMVENIELQDLSERTLRQAEALLENLQAIDLGLRGYVITRHDSHFGHYQQAINGTAPGFERVQDLLSIQNFKSDKFPELKKAMENYVSFCNKIIDAINKEEDEVVREMISMDKGYEAWSIYQDFYKDLLEYEKSLIKKAQEDYNKASAGSIWIMLTLLAFTFPTLSLIVFLLKKADKKRKQLFRQLEENNRKFNFNPGTEINISSEYELIDGYIHNSKKAAEFVNKVSAGEYNVTWEGLNEKNIELNKENLAGALIKMRNKMKAVKEEEEKRLWATKGLAEFSELIRHHQNDLQALTHECLVFLVKYLNAQQGGLFVVNVDENKKASLELKACYAFDRKKFIQKEIEPGEGLIGQAFLEAQTIYFTEIPDGYTSITSGLGDSTPDCLLIVPMKFNDEVKAVIEIASFIKYEQYQIEFLEKVGEFVASAISSVQTNEMTRKLLVEAQKMTEELKSQEEEMRQNVEELSATQEEMARKEKGYIARINELESLIKAS